MGGSPNRNVVLICLDSVRKDYFDSTASIVPELADVSFDQCRAASSWSGPSYASMVSGLLPHQHGVHTHSQSFDSLSREDTVFGDLDGYRTVGISTNVYAGPEFGFDQYFDKFVEVASHTPFPEGADPQRFLNEREGNVVKNQLAFLLYALQSDCPLQSVGNGMAGLARKASLAGFTPRIIDDGAKGIHRVIKRELVDNEPTFVFISLMETHLPHEPALYLDSEYYDCPQGWSSEERDVWDLCTSDDYDEQYWTRRNQLYRAAIDYLDRVVSEMVETIEAVTDLETTTIVTADHGENLGTEVDENLANHKSSLSEGLLHVPFYLINPPPGYQANEKRSFIQLELRELIEGVANGRTPDVFRETVPAEVVGMSPGPDPDSDFEYWDRMIRCGIEGSTKVIWDSFGNVERYELNDERTNWQRRVKEIEEVPDWARDMFEVEIVEYKQSAMDTEKTIDVGDATRERLKELGYL